jgi:hypothetical protein
MARAALRRLNVAPVRTEARRQRTLEKRRRNQERDTKALAAAELLERQLVDPIDPINPPLDFNPDPMQVDQTPQLPNQEIGTRNNILLRLKTSTKLAYDLEAKEDK